MKITLDYGNSGDTTATPTVLTDALIIGTGPAGGALACFLASHGINGMMISAAPSTADTPRAHITNMGAMECLRDIGLDTECNRLATDGKNMMHTTWAYSMAGEEYARIHAWGHGPARKGDYETASPCDPVDLPQTLLEPILLRYATPRGINCRFDTTFVKFVQDETGVTTTLRDQVTGIQYQIRSKYLFGADGTRSEVLRQLELPLDVRPDQGVAFNVHFKADLSRYMQHRPGVLHWLFQPDKNHPDFAWSCIARMVKPWDEWLFIVLPERGKDLLHGPDAEEWCNRIKEFIGDSSIPVELLNVSKWRINDVVAERYSKDRVFCLGDAVHRHPPSNGLGSNTCIQDAYNLAWKVAYVLKGHASPSLLETYNAERQPVGRSMVTRTNQSFRHHGPLWDALGVVLPTIEQRTKALQELSLPTPGGRDRRGALRAAIEETEHEYHALGQEMGQNYRKSPGIYTADEKAPFADAVALGKDPDLDLIRSTYPGSRVPHVWLNTRIPGQRISTIDLTGKSVFTLFTGIGGECWKRAAADVEKALGLTVQVYSIGFRQDYEDVYLDWERIRGVDETGCVLVRPDRFVAWRSTEALRTDMQCMVKLCQVLLHTLGRIG